IRIGRNCPRLCSESVASVATAGTRRRNSRTRREGGAGCVNRRWKIPTGFRPSAQGCEERATLGQPSNQPTTQSGLCTPSCVGLRRNPVGVGCFRVHHPGLLVLRNSGLEDTIPLELKDRIANVHENGTRAEQETPIKPGKSRKR